MESTSIENFCKGLISYWVLKSRKWGVIRGFAICGGFGTLVFYIGNQGQTRVPCKSREQKTTITKDKKRAFFFLSVQRVL